MRAREVLVSTVAVVALALAVHAQNQLSELRVVAVNPNIDAAVITTAPGATRDAMTITADGHVELRLVAYGNRAHAIITTPFDSGAGAGRIIRAAHNNNAETPAAGTLHLCNALSRCYFLWVDRDGLLRMSGGVAPTWANDKSGIVIGGEQ